jgi:hypothetical protein
MKGQHQFDRVVKKMRVGNDDGGLKTEDECQLAYSPR